MEGDTKTSMESLRAWSISNYGIIMERAKTTLPSTSRPREGLQGILEEPGGRGARTAPNTSYTAAPGPSAVPSFPRHQKREVVISSALSSVSSISATQLNTAPASNIVIPPSKLFRSKTSSNLSSVKSRDKTSSSMRSVVRRVVARSRDNKTSVPLPEHLGTRESENQLVERRDVEKPITSDEDRFADLMYYKSRTTGDILIPNPVHYAAISSTCPRMEEPEVKVAVATTTRQLLRQKSLLWIFPSYSAFAEQCPFILAFCTITFKKHCKIFCSFWSNRQWHLRQYNPIYSFCRVTFQNY